MNMNNIIIPVGIVINIQHYCHNCQTLAEKDAVLHRVAEVAREHGWHPPKSLD